MIDGAPLYRVVIFIGFFALFSLVELFFSRRSFTPQRTWRWGNNLGLHAVNGISIKVFSSLIPIYAAHEGGFFAELPLFWNALLGVILLDFLIYWQHRLTHHVPLLWRLHRVHHTDTELDATTALRFHTLEILLSLVIKVLAIRILGIGVWGVFLFEVILNTSAMFNHANINLGAMDRLLRPWIVTPDMHRIHHSVYVDECNSNYGFFLSIWDHLLGTHTKAPRDGDLEMKLGVEEFRSPSDQRLDALITQPFR